MVERLFPTTGRQNQMEIREADLIIIETQISANYRR